MLAKHKLVNLSNELEFLKSATTYRGRLRSIARGLWSGVYSQVEFVDEIIDAIEFEFPRAWNEGAARCGIAPQELTPAELDKLRITMNEEFTHIPKFMNYVVENRRGVGLLRDVNRRAAFWSQAYMRVANLAQIMACQDKKLKWTLHPAEHCFSCLKLDGKVKRASFWASQGVHPKAYNKLECKQNCKCTLEPTDDPATAGALPALP